MPVSPQKLKCCICGIEYETTCNGGTQWVNGVCSMRCHYEKEWRRTLSVLGMGYEPDTREFDDRGYPVKEKP